MTVQEQLADRSLRNRPTQHTPVAELSKGDVIWISRKARGTLSRDIIGILVSDVTIEGTQAFFDHVDTEVPLGVWHLCTSSAATFEVILMDAS